jgi:hypothetical protein
MRQIKPGEQPYHTTNAILAYCLHLAGVPWNEPGSETKRPRPCRVLYSAAILRKFTDASGRPIYEGQINPATGKRWEFEEGVIDAHKKGRRGHVEYVFQRVPRLRKLLRAYSDQEKQLEKGEGYVHELVQDLIKQFNELEPDIAMIRLACIMLKSRLSFMSLWQYQVPCMMIPNEGEVETHENVVEIKGKLQQVREITHPGYRIMSVNAKKETREHLGV